MSGGPEGSSQRKPLAVERIARALLHSAAKALHATQVVASVWMIREGTGAERIAQSG